MFRQLLKKVCRELRLLFVFS